MVRQLDTNRPRAHQWFGDLAKLKVGIDFAIWIRNRLLLQSTAAVCDFNFLCQLIKQNAYLLRSGKSVVVEYSGLSTNA